MSSAPKNEPVRSYEPGSKQKASLKSKLKEMASQKVEIPLIIGGKEIRTGKTKKVVMPHNHSHVLAEFHLATPKEMELAVIAATKAKKDWESLDWKKRASIFEKAADLLAGSFRDTINASTMLGQSKNCYQAEIDAACELIDFFRFNNMFYQSMLEHQPQSIAGVHNQMQYRPLEGFVFSITPFNFTSIAANLGTAPALLGNTVLWKPSDTQMLSAYYTMKLLKEAGLPDGVINFFGADGPESGNTLLPHRDLAGVHFTGSTQTFRTIYNTIGTRISEYRSYPRIVGETGGKDFVFAHESADADAVVANLVRGAFEYQGQKCSAASRAYIPKKLWASIKDKLVSEIQSIKMGDVEDFSCFMNAVIDARSFQKISSFIEHAKNSKDAEIICGGEVDDSQGYFVKPTVILAKDPKYKTMVEEIFGPVLTVFVYDESDLEQTLEICDKSTSYALTGAIFAQDQKIIDLMSESLKNAAGNFYINDKPTGAVVWQQPFGGARASGTNDKAGSMWNLIRWSSPRTIKTVDSPVRDYRYPFLNES